MATAAASLADVRAWAREQGLQVGDRGRLPSAVLEEYANAHPSSGAAARRVKPGGAKKGPTATRKTARRAVAPTHDKAPKTALPRTATPVVAAAPAKAEAPEHRRADSGDEFRHELERLREEVAVLRQELDTTKSRLSEVEQRRGLFSRSKR